LIMQALLQFTGRLTALLLLPVGGE
jgi:hypothetical protein